jgi:hypothetical protein
MIARIASKFAITATILVRLHVFPSLRRAQRRLKQLEEKRLLKFLGYVSIPGHGTEKAYARKRMNTPQHNVELTYLLLPLLMDGVDTDDEQYHSDSVVWIAGKVFRYEVDRDTENLKETKRLMEKYDGVDRPVLWIAPDDTRKKELMRLSNNPQFLFATFADALTPHEPVWESKDGKKGSLPRGRADMSAPSRLEATGG